MAPPMRAELKPNAQAVVLKAINVGAVRKIPPPSPPPRGCDCTVPGMLAMNWVRTTELWLKFEPERRTDVAPEMKSAPP